jgi:hypothetical protein
MFAAYFDAGGTATRGGVMSIAGFVSDVRKWKRFETEWTKILDRESVSCFHMTDFVSSQGQFKSWAEQGNRRRRFIADLVQCARKHTNKAFGGALVLSAYDALNRRYQLQECAGYPYALCGNYCIKMVRKWQMKNRIKNVDFLFERGDEHQSDLTRICHADGIIPLYPSKEEAIPCQAADLLAWRTRYGFEQALNPEKLTDEKVQRLKESLGHVWSKIPHEAFYGDRERLAKFCIDWGIPRR